MVRKVSDTIKKSVWQLTKDIIKEWQRGAIVTENKTDRIMTNTANGNMIYFSGLDDPEKLKSIAGITSVVVEEITELEEADLDQINLRLRGKTKHYKQIMGMFNPISEDHWLKRKFFDSPPPSCTTITTTYKDNHFIDQDYKDVLEGYAQTDENYYRIYTLGEWGTVQTGQEYFDKFSRSVHVRECAEDSDLPHHLLFDFNNLPYATCLVVQREWVGDTEEIRVINEICPPPPANTIDDISEEFFSEHVTNEVMYSGDPSGRAKHQRKSRTEKKNYVTQIQDAFSGYTHNRSNHFPRKAPPLANRRIAFKMFLTGRYPQRLVIDPKCKNLIGDFERLVVDDNGGWLKKRVTDKVTKQSYEERGHCADALTYHLYYHHPEWFKKRG